MSSVLNAGFKGDQAQITIYIPTFNRAETLGRAIRSALAQKLFEPTIQILVLDDGSTDETNSILKLYENDVTIKKFSKNRGIGWISFNALSIIETEYFVRLDSDDFFGVDFLRVLSPIARHANPKFDVISCNYLQVDEREFRSEILDLSGTTDLQNFGAGMLFKTASVVAAGGYDKNLRTREDLDLHLKLEKVGALRFHVPVPLYRRYVRGDNLSLKNEHKTKKIGMIRDAKKI